MLENRGVPTPCSSIMSHEVPWLRASRSGTVQSVAKVWHLLPHNPDQLEQLGKALRVPPIVAQLLLNRGVSEPETARRFLDAPLRGLHAPELLPGVPEAADRLLAAVR